MDLQPENLLTYVGHTPRFITVTQKPHSSFRLSPEAKALLEALAAHYGLTLTGALELAIRESARKAKVKK